MLLVIIELTASLLTVPLRACLQPTQWQARCYRKRQSHAAQVSPQILSGDITQLKSAQQADAAAPAAYSTVNPPLA